MNTFITIVGILFLFISIAVWIFKSLKNKKAKLCKYFALIGVVIFVLGCSFTIVPTGYTGVKTTFGQISEKTLPKGFNFKIPFVQSIELVNNKQQDVKIDAEVWGETLEKTPVYASNIIVSYQINPDKSSWIFAKYSDPDNLIDSNIVSSAIKSALIELSVDNVTNRSKIEPLVKEKLSISLNEKYGENTITVAKVVINQMDFEESYNDAIAEKSIARQKQEKQEIENQTAINKAEADKQVAITNAEAKAEALRIEAEGEADANEKIKNSLNDAVLKSKFYEKWNGTLPQAMGSDTIITSISETK